MLERLRTLVLGLTAALLVAGFGLIAHLVLRATSQRMSVVVVAPHRMAPGQRTALRVLAVDGPTRAPVADAGVTVLAGGKPIARARTDGEGEALVELTLPDVRRQVVDVEVGRGLDLVTLQNVAGEYNLDGGTLITTDRESYAPGDTVHVKLVFFDELRRTQGPRDIPIEIEGPGVEIHGEGHASRLGVASFDYPLAKNAAPGAYEIRTFPCCKRSFFLGSAPAESTDERRTALPTAIDIRSDRATYRPGDVANVEVRGAPGPVFFSVARRDRAIAWYRLVISGDRASVSVPITAGMAGTLELRARQVVASADGELPPIGYPIERWWKSDEAVRQVVVIQPDELTLGLALERDRYQAGDTAKLGVTVSGRHGAPAEAAVIVAGVERAHEASLDSIHASLADVGAELGGPAPSKQALGDASSPFERRSAWLGELWLALRRFAPACAAAAILLLALAVPGGRRRRVIYAAVAAAASAVLAFAAQSHVVAELDRKQPVVPGRYGKPLGPRDNAVFPSQLGVTPGLFFRDIVDAPRAATVSFRVPTQPGKYVLVANAIARDGRLGTSRIYFSTVTGEDGD